MNRASDRRWSRAAAGIAAALLAGAVSDAGAEDAAEEPTREQVDTKVREVHRSVRDAERALARSLVVGERGAAARDAGAAGTSIAKLLGAVRDDSRRAAAAMQWLVDNAPQ